MTGGVEDLLPTLLHDLYRRATRLRDRLAAIPHDSDLADHILAGYRDAESVRREVEQLLADPSLGSLALIANQFRAAQNLERAAGLIESYFVPFLERYAASDRRLTGLCHLLTTQVRWPLPRVLVVTFSSQYYWTFPDFRLVCAPALGETTLLRLPDLCHELGHILLQERWSTLVGTFVQELSDYIDQERRRAIANQRSPHYVVLYDQLFVDWRDHWLLEFGSDMIATYVVGPAFGWQHIRLCAGEGQEVYHPSLGESATHPADEARLRATLTVLDRMGSNTGGRMKALWDAYVATRRERTPADYTLTYPQHLFDSLAAHIVDGCDALGLRPFDEPVSASDPKPDIPSLIGQAWEEVHRDPAAYAIWEQQRLIEVWTALGLLSP